MVRSDLGRGGMFDWGDKHAEACCPECGCIVANHRCEYERDEFESEEDYLRWGQIQCWGDAETQPCSKAKWNQEEMRYEGGCRRTWQSLIAWYRHMFR